MNIITSDPTLIPLTVAIENFLSYYAAGTDNTSKARIIDMRHFATFAEKQGIQYLTDVTQTDVRDFIQHKLECESPTTVERRIATLKKFYKMCCQKFEGMLDPTSGIRHLKVSKGVPKSLSPAETGMLLDAINTHEKSFRTLRTRVVILLGLKAGLRCAEVSDLRMSNLSTDLKTIIKFKGKGSKYSNIPICPMLEQAIREYLPFRERELGLHTNRYKNLPTHEKQMLPVVISCRGGVLSSPDSFKLSHKSVFNLIRSVGTEAGLKRMHPHKLRHTFARTMLGVTNNNVALVKQLMRHDSIASTEIYLQHREDELRDAINRG